MGHRHFDEATKSSTVQKYKYYVPKVSIIIYLCHIMHGLHAKYLRSFQLIQLIMCLIKILNLINRIMITLTVIKSTFHKTTCQAFVRSDNEKVQIVFGFSNENSCLKSDLVCMIIPFATVHADYLTMKLFPNLSTAELNCLSLHYYV